jgi:hypothetical protein
VEKPLTSGIAFVFLNHLRFIQRQGNLFFPAATVPPIFLAARQPLLQNLTMGQPPADKNSISGEI